MLRDARPLKLLAVHAAVIATYYACGKLGLGLAFDNPSATPVWPPTGLALGLVLLLSRRIWPGIFAGAFLVNITTAGTPLTSLAIAGGNALEALLGAALVERYAQGRDALARAEHLFRFVLSAALAGSVSTTIGVGTLLLGGLAEPGQAPRIALTWWLGNTSGALVVAPLLLAWALPVRPRLHVAHAGEAVLLAGATVLVTQVAFGGLLPLVARGYPMTFLCLPLMLWSALRFGQRGAASAVAALAILATWGTLRGYGPFAAFPPAEALLQLQVFLVVSAVTALVVAAVVGERHEAEEHLQRLAVSDPLTGLANYRMLIDRLHAEIARAQRPRRPFVVLFMDLDGLKRINDRYGHVTGNRALLRLSWVLKESCRSVDLPARFGGDEFAVVMPETDVAGANAMVARLDERLARSSDKPPITISTGFAVFPVDGDTPEKLLQVADERLYARRARDRGR